MVSKMGMSGSNGLPYIIDTDGNVRVLARLQPTAEHRQKMAARQTFTQVLQAQGLDLIPESEWREIDNAMFDTPEYNLNQQSSSGCTGYSAAAGLMKIRAAKGFKFKRLSGSGVYQGINGNQDAGSVITDAEELLEQFGTCEESLFNFPNIFASQMSAAAKKNALRYRLGLGPIFTSAAEAATAIQMGYFPQFPIEVGANYQQFDSEGVAGLTRAQYGNHSVHAYGMKKSKRFGWIFKQGNTWGFNWGPFQKGYVFLNKDHIDSCASQGDAYIHADALEDPEDSNVPTPQAA